jgi:hypothetical protein
MKITSRFMFNIFTLLALLALIFAPLGVAPALAAQTGTDRPSVEQFLNPDGMLKTDAGYSGSLDIGNYNVTLDPARGPVFSPQAALTPNAWNALGTGLKIGSVPLPSAGRMCTQAGNSPMRAEMRTSSPIGNTISEAPDRVKVPARNARLRLAHYRQPLPEGPPAPSAPSHLPLQLHRLEARPERQSFARREPSTGYLLPCRGCLGQFRQESKSNRFCGQRYMHKMQNGHERLLFRGRMIFIYRYSAFSSWRMAALLFSSSARISACFSRVIG